MVMLTLVHDDEDEPFRHPGGLNFAPSNRMVVRIAYCSPLLDGGRLSTIEARLGTLDGLVRSLEWDQNVAGYYVTWESSTGPLSGWLLGLTGQYAKWLTSVEGIDHHFHYSRRQK